MASNFGQFAGSFARAFSSAQNAKAEKEERDKEAKLRGQLLELQVKQIQKQTEAQGRTEARLQPGGFDRPGRLAELVPSGSTEIGGRGVPQFESAGASPQELMQDPQSLSDLIVSGQARLADFTGAGQKAPADLLMLRAAGIDPASPEGRKLISQSVGGRADSPTDELAAQLNIDLAEQRLEGGKAKVSAAATEEEQAEQLSVFAIEDFGTQAIDAIDLSKAIGGSDYAFFGTSVAEGAHDIQSVIAGVGQLFGVSSPEYTQAVSNAEQLEKVYAEIEAKEQRKMIAGGNRLTIELIRSIRQRVPTMDKQPSANFKLMANILEADLKRNIIKKVPMTKQQIAQAKKEIKALRDEAKTVTKTQKRGPTLLEQAKQKFGAGSDRAKNLAGQVGGFAQRGVSAARPRIEAGLDTAQSLAGQGAEQASALASVAVQKAQRGLATAQDIGAARFEELQQIDFSALSGDAYNAAVAKWESLGGPKIVRSAEEIAVMSIEELQQIDPKKLSADLKLAARARYDELFGEQ